MEPHRRAPQLRRDGYGRRGTGDGWHAPFDRGTGFSAEAELGFRGIGRKLSGDVSVGLKAQWKRFEAFESDRYEGDLLRSHPPNLRLDGSEPVSAWSRTGDTGRFSVLFTVRYAAL